ncbi:hypothetical protein ON010_g9831 [Phytophthora cinnamomi]|nr:hypothetical protein ON010_g9831 [Phytophthora cinnamomi]
MELVPESLDHALCILLVPELASFSKWRDRTGTGGSGGPLNTYDAAAEPADAAVLLTPGKTPRVLVLLCANGTGTHKIPLLLVGKDKAPSCLTPLNSQLSRAGGEEGAVSAVYGGAGMRASYFSQREVWCDDRTFQHWCERVFLPAIRERTTQPVLLVAENPGGRLEEFQRENVKTVFLPLRPGSGEVSLTSQEDAESGAAGIGTADGSSSAQVQPLHGAVIRDLKRRYKVGLFQERLSFLEKSAEDKYRLMQRAGKKPAGSAGVAFGRVPHILDAMSLLDEAWAATTPALIRGSWAKSHLGNPTAFPPPVSTADPEVSDDALVMELCSMMRNKQLVDDMNQLAKELRYWLHADADSSERMQQELLYDIQQLLQEEEQQEGETELAHQQEFQAQQSNSFLETAGLPTTFESNQPDSLELRSTNSHLGTGPAADAEAVLNEKRKSIDLALQGLARAEEALDDADVADFFGEEAAGQAKETISRALRRLQRIQRGKQSALVAAAVNAVANGDSSDNTGGALNTHEFFYGNGSLRGIP